MQLISRANERYIFNRGKFIIRMVSPGLKVKNPGDPLGLGPLGRMDHSTLDPGMVIPMHPHANDEILSYMRIGKMVHRDSHGLHETLHGTHMMMMNSGKEIWHEETCLADADEKIEMLQIFIRPRKDDLEPMVQFADLDEYRSRNAWRLIGGPEASDAPLKIRSAVSLHDTYLENSSITTPPLSGKQVGFLYVFDGEVEIGDADEQLNKGDNLVTDTEVAIKTAASADLVFFTLDLAAEYSRNGMYAR
jgi:redox-sensitive bicupin YhaK (pirin superfamily)